MRILVLAACLVLILAWILPAQAQIPELVIPDDAVIARFMPAQGNSFNGLAAGWHWVSLADLQAFPGVNVLPNFVLDGISRTTIDALIYWPSSTLNEVSLTGGASANLFEIGRSLKLGATFMLPEGYGHFAWYAGVGMSRAGAPALALVPAASSAGVTSIIGSGREWRLRPCPPPGENYAFGSSLGPTGCSVTAAWRF